jgi:hypothetical protein
MNKETLKEFLSWLVDKGYIHLVNSQCTKAIHLSRTMREMEMEFYQEKRDQKLNDLLG